MDRHFNTKWPLAILFALSALTASAQGDCGSPECLLFEQMDNETPGLSGSGDLMGDFPDDGSCLTAVENANIYSFEALMPGDVEVILSAQAGITMDQELQIGLFTATDACQSATYTTVDCATTQDQVSLTDVGANTGDTYYIIVNGANLDMTPAELGYTIQIAGSAVELDPPFNVDPVYTINIGQEVQLSASDGASEYDWEVVSGEQGSIVSGGDSPTPIVNPRDTTVYSLMTTLGGCELEYQVTVNVIVTIFARNVITPNDDGFNDRWFIGNAFLYPTMDVRVFSRWGQQVFRSTGYDTDQNGWDGTNKGSKLPAGNYYFVIDLLGDGNEESTVTGSVAIIY